MLRSYATSRNPKERRNAHKHIPTARPSAHRTVGTAPVPAPRKHMTRFWVSDPTYIEWHVVEGWCHMSVSVKRGGEGDKQGAARPKAQSPTPNFCSRLQTPQQKCDPYDGTQKIHNYECHGPPRANTEVKRSNRLHFKRRLTTTP